MPLLAQNKRAAFEYTPIQKFEAGLALSGKLVKELRNHRVNLQGRFVIFQQGQLQIIGFGNDVITENVALLVNKKELHSIVEALAQKGVTCVLNKIFTSKRWIKAEIWIAKGKKNYDKREDIKKRDLDREQRRQSL